MPVREGPREKHSFPEKMGDKQARGREKKQQGGGGWHLDALGGGGAEPVAVGGEDEGVDDVISWESVEALALVQVPKHGDSILAARGAE